MKKLLKRNLMAILAVLCAFTCAIAVFSVAPAVKAATPITISQATINIKKGAEIKTIGNMGIRFTASISADDYLGLEENYGAGNVEYGMLIVPADFIKNADTDLKIGGWEYADGDMVTEYVKGVNETGKLYQRATVTPAFKDGVYAFNGSFVNIDTTNYDRDFAVRAYVSVGDNDGDIIYTDIVSRSVYTVATNAIASGAFEDDAEGLTYMEGVSKTVYDEYTTRSVSYENLTDGKQKTDKPAVGDKISFVTTLSNGTNTITGKPVMSDYGEYLTENLNEDEFFDGTYTVQKEGDFGVLASICGSYTGLTNTPSVYVDCVNTKTNAVDITLENTAEGQEWAGFFTTYGNGSIAKLDSNTADATGTTALSTCPTGEDVYVVNTPKASADKISLGVGMKDKLLNKYISFKFYNYGYHWLSYSFSMNERHAWHGSLLTLSGHGDTGRYVRTFYDQYGNDILYNIVTDPADTASFTAYEGTWCTVEIAMIHWFGDGAKGISLHTDNFGDVYVYPNIYISDIKVSDAPIKETYSDLELRVTGATGENGVAKPGDELSISAYALPLGATEKVKVSAGITATNNALDGNIYQGTGDFTITASAFGQTATLTVNGEVGVAPKYKLLTIDNLMAKGNKKTEVTISEIAEGIPAGAPAGKAVYKATFTAYGDQTAVGVDTSLLYSGCYLTFRYYLGTSQRIGFEANWWVHTTSGETGIYDASANTNTNLGGPIIKHVAHDGTFITSSNIKSYEGTWATLEIQYTKSAPAQDYAKVYLNAYGYGDSNLYLTDITITNYSTLAQN